jgi:hypothetical protein
MGFIHLQIECNPWLGGYRHQIPVLSVLYPQLNLLNPTPENIPAVNTPPPFPPDKKFLGMPQLPEDIKQFQHNSNIVYLSSAIPVCKY